MPTPYCICSQVVPKTTALVRKTMEINSVRREFMHVMRRTSHVHRYVSSCLYRA
jgi:hypothetical protein